MWKEVAEKLEAAMGFIIVVLVLLMALALTSLATYIVTMTCWRCGVLLSETIFKGRW